LSLLPCNFSLEYAIERVLANQEGSKLNGTHQHLVYALDVNLLGPSIHIIIIKSFYSLWSMKSFQALQTPAIPLTLFRDILVLLISSSIVLHHILFSPPLLLYPRGFQSNAVFSIAPVSLRNVCPIQFHFLLFI